MKQYLIEDIEKQMLPYLNNQQIDCLHQVLIKTFQNIKVEVDDGIVTVEDQFNNEDLILKFISAKSIEGCSVKTIKYYQSTLLNMNKNLNKHITRIETDDLRIYLLKYQHQNNCSKTNIDNIRRILSSFFSWLEEENIILKSPMRRIHKIKTDKIVKEIYSDESLELMRDNVNNLRDLAIIDLLASTGMRVGELVKLNINDIDFDNRECVVFGKGSKERIVYFDARTKIHLKNYLNQRNDENNALFVSLRSPYKRLEISGVEIMLRKLGHKLNIKNVHPHRFRRTLATRAIDKGMPIEQVQTLLGHTRIDTTMHYAMVDQNNVKISHRKFIA